MLKSNYGASFFRDAMAWFTAQWQNPQLNQMQTERSALNINLLFIHVSTYHHIKFTLGDDNAVVDNIHIQPSRKDKRGQRVPGWFDTVLVDVDLEGNGIQSMYNLTYCELLF